MTTRKEMVSLATKFWENDNNCAQSTARALVEAYNYMDASKIYKDSLVPLGGGIGEGSICGAATGSLIGMNYILTQAGCDKDTLINAGNLFKESFSLSQDSLRCRDLLLAFTDEEGNVDKENPKRRERCTAAIQEAISIVYPIIETHLRL